MGYTKRQQRLALVKVLPPNNRSVHEVSKDLGINARTIYKWMKMVTDGTLKVVVAEDPGGAGWARLEEAGARGNFPLLH